MSELSTTPLFRSPEIPSKWDIIPIHTSDRANFKRCRRYWDWSSPARNNLTVRADIHGVNTDLWFGTGIHWSLEQFYNPILRRDPVESWKTWFDIQWRGGVVTAEWLPLVYDLDPQKVESDTWRVKGLKDIIPAADVDGVFSELFELGVGMMEFYKDYAARNDDFQVVMVEHNFSVPIWDYENNKILTAIDSRTDSPNFGKELEVHARGRQDALKVRISNEKLGVLENKTAKAIGEDYFEKLENDEQCTAYLYSAMVEARYYDLPHKDQPIEEVLYNVLRKASPKPPTMLKNGMFSMNRTDESTTPQLLEQFIRQNMPGVTLNEKQQGYVDWVRESGDEQFIIRKSVKRTRAELASFGQRLYLEALDMLNEPRIYPNITNDWLCRKCQFRSPCLETEAGGDATGIIETEYTSSRDR